MRERPDLGRESVIAALRHNLCISLASAWWLIGCASSLPSRQAAVQETAPVTASLGAAGSAAEEESLVTREISAMRHPWRFAGVEGQIITTDNFRIYTTVLDIAHFNDRLPAFAEHALDHYTTALGRLPRPTEPLETYLFRNRSQWQVMTQRMLPEQAGDFSALGRGGFTTRGIAVLYYIDHSRSFSSRDTFAIAAHEGWHQYTQQTFQHQLPIWLEEGIATYMESFSLTHEGVPQFRPWANAERRNALAQAVRSNRLIPLTELLHGTPQNFLQTGKDRLLTYYAQVWALTRYLADGEDGRYRGAMEDLLQDAAHGRLVSRLLSSTHIQSPRRRTTAATSRSGPWVILEYFNGDLAEFEDGYLSFIESLLERGRR